MYQYIINCAVNILSLAVTFIALAIAVVAACRTKGRLRKSFIYFSLAIGSKAIDEMFHSLTHLFVISHQNPLIYINYLIGAILLVATTKVLSDIIIKRKGGK